MPVPVVPEVDLDSASSLADWREEGDARVVTLPPWLERQKEVAKIVADALPETTTLIGFGGGVGGGKSHVAARMAYVLATAFPGNRILVGRQELKTLKTTTMEEFFKICPGVLIAKRNEAEQWVAVRRPEWPAGLTSRIFFRPLENWMGLASEQYGAVIIDEATEVSLEAALMLFTRLRHRLPRAAAQFRMPECVKCGYRDKGITVCPHHGDTLSRDGMKQILLCTFNPWPSWVVDWFYHKKYPEALNNPDLPVKLHFVRSLAKDNPHTGPNYVAIQRALLSGQPGLAERLIDGRFDIFPGAVYEIWDEEKHGWLADSVEALPKFVRLIGGLDFGGESENSDETAGIVRGVMASGRNIRLGVFKEKGADVDRRHMEWMVAMQAIFADRNKRKIEWCADKTQGRGINLMRRAGFRVVPSAGGNHSVEFGVKAVARGYVIDPNTKLPGSYYWTKGPGMHHYIEEVKKYRRDPATLSIVRGQADHVMDADRYAEELLDRRIGDPGRLFPGAVPGVR